MELEVSSNVSAHAHGDKKHKMNFRKEHVSSVCQCDDTAPSHVGSWGGAGPSSAAEATSNPGPAEMSLGMGLPECCWGTGRCGGERSHGPEV